MKARVSLFLLPLLFSPLGCPSAKVAGAPAPPALTDSIELVSVTPPSGSTLPPGQPVRFEVTLNYSLHSRKSALLSLSMAQYRNPDSCVVSPGELIDSDEVEVKRGSGTLHLPITWPGDTGFRTKGRVLGYGSISFTGMFWKAHLQDRFLLKSFGDAYCTRFGIMPANAASRLPASPPVPSDNPSSPPHRGE